MCNSFHRKKKKKKLDLLDLDLYFVLLDLLEFELLCKKGGIPTALTVHTALGYQTTILLNHFSSLK